MIQPRFSVEVRALERAILAPGLSFEQFRKNCRMHEKTFERLLDPQAKRDFRASAVRILLKELKVSPEKILLGDYPEEALSALKPRSRAVKRNKPAVSTNIYENDRLTISRDSPQLRDVRQSRHGA